MCKQMMMIVLMLILSYLIGAIPNGYVIGKVFFKKDIREFGSGNTGATRIHYCIFPIMAPSACAWTN